MSSYEHFADALREELTAHLGPENCIFCENAGLLWFPKLRRGISLRAFMEAVVHHAEDYGI